MQAIHYSAYPYVYAFRSVFGEQPEKTDSPGSCASSGADRAHVPSRPGADGRLVHALPLRTALQPQKCSYLT
jgi:hypothetical protein